MLAYVSAHIRQFLWRQKVVARDHNNWSTGAEPANLRQLAIDHPGQSISQQNQVKGAMLHPLQSLLGVAGSGRLVPTPRQNRGQESQRLAVIVHIKECALLPDHPLTEFAVKLME